MKKTTKPFIPPTLQEIQDYIHENNYKVDAVAFLWHYSKLGWRNVNNKLISSWKQTLIQVWVSKQQTTESPDKKITLYPIKGRVCGIQGCSMPAVYSNAKGGFTYYRCGGHLPDEVKEKYA